MEEILAKIGYMESSPRHDEDEKCLTKMSKKGVVNPGLDISDEIPTDSNVDEVHKVDMTNEDFDDLIFERNVLTEKIEAFNDTTARLFADHSGIIAKAGKGLIFLLYNVFFLGAILYYHHHPDGGIQWCDGLGFLIIVTTIVYSGMLYQMLLKPLGVRLLSSQSGEKLLLRFDEFQDNLFKKPFTSPMIYLAIYLTVLIYLIVDSGSDLDRLRSFLGLNILVFLGFFFSKSPSKVVWRHVVWGLSLQFLFAIFIIKLEVGASIFACLGQKVSALLAFTDKGSGFVFGYLVTQDPVNLGALGNGSVSHQVFSEIYQDGALGFVFMFKVLSVIYFLSFLVSMLFHIGAMQWLVSRIGWVLQVTVGTTACESLNAAANIFLGQTESPLMIKPYLPIMTNSEIHSVMTGGFATIAGTVLAAYISFDIDAAHLLSASVMSAPAALACAKLMYPETKVSKTKSGNLPMPRGSEVNLLDAASQGAASAVHLVANIAGTLIAVLAFVAFLNGILSWCGWLIGFPDDNPLTFELILGKFFIPLSWLMGVHIQDLEEVGILVGLKTFATEFAAYSKMRTMTQLQDRSRVIATYALCGFSNLASVGILVAALSSMAPSRRGDIASVAVRALVSGSLACFMTACVAGCL
eukprot:maker-scaffold148_size310697-snap-gene-1.22 protein:Tk10304 transcript:maker-scaffold148_size310697-snap-gene-1.22-mRNA-1 annotation:"hypothetical protein DAPPUDRAFT_22032"